MAGFLGEADVPGWGRWSLDDGSQLDVPFTIMPAPAAPMIRPPDAVLTAPIEAAPLFPSAPPIPPPAPVESAPPALVEPAPRAPLQAPPFSPDPLVAIDQAEQVRGDSIMRQADIEQQAADVKAARDRVALGREQEQLENEERRRGEIQDAGDAALQQIEQGRKELAAESLDSGRWWGNRSTGQKIGAAIGLAIHGFLNPTGPNGMAEAINRAIDRDMEDQRANLAKRAADIQSQQTLLQINRQRWGDELTAMAATRADLRDLAARETEAMLAGIKSPITQERGLQAVAELRGQSAKDRESIINGRKQLALQSQSVALQRRASEQPPPPDEKAMRLQREQGIPELGGFVAPTVDEAKQFRQQLAANAQVQKLLDERKALFRKSGSEKLPGSQKAALQANSTQLLLAIKRGEEMGALDKGAIEIGQRAFGDESSWFDDPLTKAESFQRYSADNLRFRANALGYDGSIGRYWEKIPGQEKGGVLPDDPKRAGGRAVQAPTVTTPRRAVDPGQVAPPGGIDLSWMER
jgi:hypothetical protein